MIKNKLFFYTLTFIVFYFSTNQLEACYDPYFTDENIKKAVFNDTYAMIESISYEDYDTTEHEKNEKFVSLGKYLSDYGLPHRPIRGSYEGTITDFSYLVIKPENFDLKTFREIIFLLGQEFNQESVILSTKGHVELVFTTGNNVGKALVGDGFNDIIGKNYSEIHTADGKNYFIGEYYIDRQTFLEWSP